MWPVKLSISERRIHKFMLTVFAAVAELEREYILQRQREGIARVNPKFRVNTI